jgi:GMP synthase-like glutamine amidotransferase
MPPALRICMLNADTPVPTVAHIYPTYGLIFHKLLASVSPNTTLQSTDFNVVLGEYPASLEAFDAIIVSGSASSAYDDEPWIHSLSSYIREVYETNPRIMIFGSCFGHQIICSSLLGEYGVRVEQDAKGWEIGVKEVTLCEEFRERFEMEKCGSSFSGNGRLRVQCVHHDHVIVPEPEWLPVSWTMIGSTEHCAVQGLYERGRVLTLQGHFEFDRFVNGECIKYFFTDWEYGRTEEALKAIDADDDSVMAAQMVMKFLMEKTGSTKGTTRDLMGGLLTPPSQE